MSHSTAVAASKHLRFQFANLEQQRLTSTLGMWIFLATEILFFCALYFIMTGLHATHMIAGLLVGSFIAYFAWRGHYTAEYHASVENFGLYWHFVDVIWIFLYPLLYLVGKR